MQVMVKIVITVAFYEPMIPVCIVLG